MDKNTKLWIEVVIGALILIAVWSGYYKGYRFGDNFMIGKLGTVSMNIPLIQTNIFIDQNQKIVTSKDNELVSLSLSPREHSIIISHDGYFPWKKDFMIPSGGKVILSPIFVTQNASGMIITKNDPEYWKIRNQITSDKLPTKDSPKIGSDNLSETWVENNTILAKVNEKVYNVIKPETPVKNLYFYKDRIDSVIFSTGNSIYVIEIDKEGTQNFIPVYKGQNPFFIETDPNFIYVLDGENLMQVII